MSEPNTTYCREFINGTQCSCEVFSEPPEDALRICRECQHGFSKHPEGLRAMERARDKHPASGAGQTRSQLPSASGPSGRQRVLAMFNEHAGLDTVECRSDGFNIQKTKPTMDEAKEEILKGYRTQPAGRKGTTKRQSLFKPLRIASQPGPLRRAASTARGESDLNFFKAGLWICLINYLDSDGQLEITSPPTRTQIHEMERRKCAHFEHADKFKFDATWSHKEVDSYLRNTVFPVPFAYIDGKVRGKARAMVGDHQWVLINKEKQQYEVVDIAEPTGADLARYQGQNKCPTKDTNMIIALCLPIPEKILASFDPNYRAPDDNIEDFSDSGSKICDTEQDVEPVRAAHINAAEKLKCFREPSVIELFDSDDQPAPKKMKTIRGAIKFKQEPPGEGLEVDMSLMLGSPTGSIRNVEQSFFRTSQGNEADDLLGSMKDMSLSPERHRNNKDKWTPAIHRSVASTSHFAGNYSGPTFRFPALPQTPLAVAEKRLPPPVDFVEPSFNDMILRQVPDPTSPASAPRINGWSEDYFLGDIM